MTPDSPLRFSPSAGSTVLCTILAANSRSILQGSRRCTEVEPLRDVRPRRSGGSGANPKQTQPPGDVVTNQMLHLAVQRQTLFVSRLLARRPHVGSSFHLLLNIRLMCVEHPDSSSVHTTDRSNGRPVRAAPWPSAQCMPQAGWAAAV